MGNTPTIPPVFDREAELRKDVRNSASGQHMRLGEYPAYSFAIRDIQPPSDLYTTPEDQLVLSVQTVGQAGLQLQLCIRLLKVDGQITTWTETIRVATSNLFQRFTFPLFEGSLLSTAITAVATVPKRGECFVELAYIRGQSGVLGNGKAQVLVSRYLEGSLSVGWPNSLIESPLNAPGAGTTNTTGNPAAGADWNISVPGGQTWLVVGVSAQFQSSAAAGNRAIKYVVIVGPGPAINIQFNLNPVAANTIAEFNAFTGGAYYFNVSGIPISYSAPLPSPLLLPSGSNISSATQGILAADQWSNIRIVCQQFLQP